LEHTTPFTYNKGCYGTWQRGSSDGIAVTVAQWQGGWAQAAVTLQHENDKKTKKEKKKEKKMIFKSWEQENDTYLGKNQKYYN
jgi:hypothetical protein